MYRVVRNSFRKANILKGYFTAEHAICNPETRFAENPVANAARFLRFDNFGTVWIKWLETCQNS